MLVLPLAFRHVLQDVCIACSPCKVLCLVIWFFKKYILNLFFFNYE